MLACPRQPGGTAGAAAAALAESHVVLHLAPAAPRGQTARVLESRPPSSSGPVTRSLFSLRPTPRAVNGAGAGSSGLGGAAAGGPANGPSGGLPAPDAPIEDIVLTKLKGAAQALPPTVAPTSVRAIRSAQLMRALSEALAPERRRFEQELARSRQRAAELEAELERIRAERRDVDETRRVELPRLAALVDQERTRAEALERERDAFAARLAELERELERRDAQVKALESALPAEPDDDDVLARVQRRLDALGAPAGAPTADPPPGDPSGDDPIADEPTGAGQGGDPAADAAAREVLAAGGSGDDDLLVQALLSSDARALRIAALEQRVAELTGEPADLPGAEEPPAARAVVALLRATRDEDRARFDRMEARVTELLEVARELHGALVEERRRRVLVEGALRAAQARLAVLEQREPPSARLPSFSSVIEGDVGPLLDAVRDEARQRDDSLDAKIQRLSLATRAALERMAEILDQALVAGLLDRDMPRLDPEAFSAPLFEALGDPATAHAATPDEWREALDALDPALARELDDVEVDDLADDDDDHDEAEDASTEPAPAPPAAPADEDPGPDVEGRGDAPAGGVAPALRRPPDPSPLVDDADPEPDGPVEEPVFVEHLDDEPEEVATEEELASWFLPGRPGQTDEEREAEQLARFGLELPPAPAAPPAEESGGDASADFGDLERLEPPQTDALRSAAAVDLERQRLEERVREAERALESEVWRGLATHRELVSTRRRLEELEARLAASAAAAPARDEVAPTVGGLEPVADVTPLRSLLAGDPTVARAAVLSLDVEDRDTWVHWLLLEQDPAFQAKRQRGVQSCADAVRSLEHDLERDEFVHWLEAEGPPVG